MSILSEIDDAMANLAGVRKRIATLIEAAAPGAAGRPSRRRTRAGKARPAPKAAQQLQGRYMARIRDLPDRKKDQVRKVRADQGVEAAVAFAEKLHAGRTVRA